MDEKKTEEIGLLIDKLDNLAHALLIPLPDRMHVEILRPALRELVAEFKAALSASAT